jgi:hypothetical protein
MTALRITQNLTAPEQRGFLMACKAFAKLGEQLSRTPSLGGGDMIPAHRAHRHTGQTITAYAQALANDATPLILQG